MTIQESEAMIRNMQTGDQGERMAAGEELGELDDEGDEEDEIVLDANNTRKADRPQG